MINLYGLLKRAFGPTAASLKPFRSAGGQRGASKTWRNTGRPNAARHWHDPAEFYQSNALEAAVLKRRRRAEKLDSLSYGELNPAHLRSIYQSGTHVGWTHPQTLNPFYVAK